ncbi:putative transcriptional regulator Ngg1 [Talaromyces proteolyticus]|uniref:Transcriptional regulator Ngg1 n=1 Tax=Talaromyces proteolyticus TaxID=1131652 RepID=A0AAD4L0A1_9EURO|nr:putative transcriptional regulator Ngg1 [Talaromyces proteolyticus]KAH8700544.1 putative transcriptional regulator Ngg1 [Talaromyces proteolyticus]
MPLANKSKGKGREARRSRSRNTTPSSGLSASTATGTSSVSGYLDNELSKLFSSSAVQYADILEQIGGGSNIPDVKTLELLKDHLKNLSQLADTRGDTCNAAMRELSQRRKEVIEDQRELELERDTEERKMKREADDEEEGHRALKGGKLKKRKERPPKEDRPLAVGAHEVARQDGGELGDRKRSLEATSPSSKKSRHVASGSTSSLSPPSLASPPLKDEAEVAESPESEDSDDSHQPEPQQLVPQFQVFGPDPLKFEDSTIYHIRDVTSETTDDMKREIYSVAHFPPSDLSHMMAGIPPDKDFSNAKPTNQVNANTFLSWVDPFVRPLTEEDIAFLKEKGDRATPFVMPRRSKKHYSEIWAEEDGAMSIDHSSDRDRLPLNQGRGSIDQLTDDVAETDKPSLFPASIRTSCPPDENNASGTTNGDSSINGILGDSFMDLDHPLGESETKPLPAATSFPDASPNNFKVPAAKLEHAQLDERLKAELRYVGFLGPEDNPDFDAHYDDDIAQRLRLLQGELKKQMLVNGARKTRLLEIAKERLAYQEYSTIHDDLDSQVQQAYLKRTRTLGKSKKGSQAKHRPGGAGGGSHVVSAAGVGRPGIGDMARTLMDRRKRWRDCIGPVFKDSKTTVPSSEESIFDPATMAEYEKAELEGWDEEQE